MAETYTVRGPFLKKDVQISDKLTDRLRGKYARGPIMPNGEPEFGWVQHEVAPIQMEAAKRIEQLENSIREIHDNRYGDEFPTREELDEIVVDIDGEEFARVPNHPPAP